MPMRWCFLAILAARLTGCDSAACEEAIEEFHETVRVEDDGEGVPPGREGRALTRGLTRPAR